MATQKEQAEWERAIELSRHARIKLEARVASTVGGSSNEWLNHFITQQFVLQLNDGYSKDRTTALEIRTFIHHGLVDMVQDADGVRLAFIPGMDLDTARAGLRTKLALEPKGYAGRFWDSEEDD